jgi:hypothetical protein
MERAQKLDTQRSMSEVATKDSGAGLILFGSLQILIGLACAMFTLYIASGSEIAVRQGAGGGAAVASGLIVYGVATVYFVSVGVGSMRRRRWAQALSVVVSAMWLAGGAVGTLFILVMLPTIEQRVANTSGAFILGGAIVVAILVPLAILLYYRQPSVRLMCETADVPRWTDRVPLPILAIIIVLAFGSLALLANLSNPVIAVFGNNVTGAPAALTLLGLSILSAWLAVQFCRLKESAWWTLVLLQVIGCVAATVSLVRGGSGRVAADDVAEVSRSPFFIAIIVASWLAYFAYLLYIRRYFALQTEPRTRRDDSPHRLT